MTAAWDLPALLNAADPRAALPERHLWWVRLFAWLRHAPRTATAPDADDDAGSPWPVRRVRHLCQLLERHPVQREKVVALLASLEREVDVVTLLADYGFAPRAAFISELFERLRNRLLPGTPETSSMAELFGLCFDDGDQAWVEALDAATIERVLALRPDRPGAPGWQPALPDAVAFVCSAVRAAGFSPALRQRMAADLLRHDPFMPLAEAALALRRAVEDGDAMAIAREANVLRALLDACRRCADSIGAHLEQHGVSLHVVFEADQLRARTLRVELLLDLWLAPAGDRARALQQLLLALLRSQAERRGVRALFAHHGTQLARQIAERSAETGEHYITRTRDEYHAMLRSAAGGGIVIAATTLVKFAIAALALSAFWGGVFAGINYAASFVLVMLLHWTVATKQPAMTAPAMAARLAEVKTGENDGDADGRDPAIEAFVDEVAHLIRSQVAGILGNVALCFPLVLVAQWLARWLFGAPLVSAENGRYVLESTSLLGPTALYAAFTGTLLFASSLIAGWVENWFVYRRLPSAIAFNPRIVDALGPARAQAWSRWWRTHIAGLAGNISLGLMLGIVPVVLHFLAVPLDVRHVTLSAGQLGAALGALGLELLRTSAFWWCAAAIPVIGALNIGVSFWLAFKVALRSRSVRVPERRRIARAIRRRVATQPMSFLKPPMFSLR